MSTGHPSALMCVYYPQQLLPGLTAIAALRSYLGQSLQAPVTIVVWSDPGVGSQFLALRKEAFERLLRALPWVALVFPSPDEIRRTLSPNFRVARKAMHLRKRFGAGAFGTVCYAHDMGSDYFAQSAMQAFPQALRVCFGDALGVVYSNEYYTRLTYPLGTWQDFLQSPRQTLRNLLWRCKRAYTLPRRKRRLDATFAAPILPCDPGGDFLPGKTLLAIDPVLLDPVLDALVRGAQAGDTGRAPRAPAPERYLMLLGSFSESGFCSEQQEHDMYLQAARAHVPEGAVLVLKAHPASYGSKMSQIAQALSAQFQVEFSQVDALPVEVLRELVTSHLVLSFSYSSVSLHYLHGSTVIHAMTAALIEQFFPPHIRRWMHESNILYLEQFEMAKRLRGGRSIGSDGVTPSRTT